jgi:hypothetical protein
MKEKTQELLKHKNHLIIVKEETPKLKQVEEQDSNEQMKRSTNTSTLQPKVQKISVLLLNSKFLYNASNHKMLGRFLQAQGKHNLLYTPTTYTKQQTRT